MDIHLVVVRPFASYGKGDVITDEAAISQVLADGHAHDVVRVLASDVVGALSHDVKRS